MSEEHYRKNRIQINKKYYESLKDQGVPWSVFAEKDFNLEQATANIVYQNERMQSITFSKKDQIAEFISVINNIFEKPFVYVISGKPADTRACCVAAALLIAGSTEHARIREEDTTNRFAKLNKPKWVKLSNDYKDNLHDASWKPSMLVLSNITPNSSAFKLEKVRDMLEFYDDIPRIVVINEYDPITFLNHKIHCKGDHVMFLEHGKKKLEV